MRLIVRTLTAVVFSFVAFGFAWAGSPKEITIGSLYAGTGNYSSVSVPLHDGLLLWVKQTNAKGGVYVGAYKKRIPVRVISYDDQGNTATVATLTNELITQDKVNVLTSDFGSVLTSVAVPIAREHKVLLIDSSGTGATLFSKGNKYVALVGQPASPVAVRYVAGFLAAQARAGKLRHLAILYDTNDFAGAEATAFRKTLARLHAKTKIVFDEGVPTKTSDYAVLLSRIQAAHPDFVLELGYPKNDIAFIRAMQDADAHFQGVFANFPGWELDLIAKDVGIAADKGMYSFMPGVYLSYKTTAGMTASEFHAAWQKAYPKGEVAYGLNAAIGYVEGVVIGQMLAHAPNLSQLGLRSGLYAVSGKLVTLQGPFRLAEDGEQLGEINALGQVWPKGKGVTLRAVYPPSLAIAKPVFGLP